MAPADTGAPSDPGAPSDLEPAAELGGAAHPDLGPYSTNPRPDEQLDEAGSPVATMTLTEAPPPPGDAAVAADDTPPGARQRTSPLRNGIEWVLIIAAALLAALVIKTYLLQAFYIPSPSMEPTLEIQDRVLVNKLSYRLHEVHRGDVLVFERPPNDLGVIRDLIKRVVALPGETVEGRDGSVYVNGKRLAEPYLPRGTVTGQFGPEQIPPDHIWVMGDNRSNSSDSRVFGAVPESRIIGRAFVRVWPLDALGLL